MFVIFVVLQEDYINPDDDNYVEPEENPSPSKMHDTNGATLR